MSVAEIIHHLCIVERMILLQLKRNQRMPAKTAGFFARLKPVAAVSFRTFKVKAPDFAVPKHRPSSNELMEMLESTRKDLKSFTTMYPEKELRRLPVKHPVLGEINGLGAVKFINNHGRRHLKQARTTLKQVKHIA